MKFFVFFGCMMKRIMLHVKSVGLCYLDYLGEVWQSPPQTSLNIHNLKMKKILTFFLSLAALLASITVAKEPYSEAQKAYIDSFPLILVVKTTEENSIIKSETPGTSQGTFYSVTTHLKGEVVEVLRARNVPPGLIHAGMPYVRHLSYRDIFDKRPTEGKQQINPPTEKIICVKTYEVQDGLLNITEYDGHIPPSSWETLREYLSEQKESLKSKEQ